jgi:hypothetical protein
MRWKNRNYQFFFKLIVSLRKILVFTIHLLRSSSLKSKVTENFFWKQVRKFYTPCTLISRIKIKVLSDVTGLSLKIRIFFARKPKFADDDLILSDSLLDKTSLYEKELTTRIPRSIKLHREYFSKNDRGFGEPIFHLMWFEIFCKYKPLKILEIGVYRGQTLSLFCLLAKGISPDLKFEVHGISPFDSTGDSVSLYSDMDYLKDCKNNLDFFKCSNYYLHKFLSLDPAAIDLIAGIEWDLIYIDGSHEYEVVKKDFENALEALKDGGIIVLDDSSLYYSHSENPERFWGWPGPSRVASTIASVEMKHIGIIGHNNIFQKLL